MDELDIYVEHHLVDGFTLSCIEYNQRIARRYIGETVEDAKEDFKEYVKLWPTLNSLRGVSS
jgi:hypothetical protein